MHLSESMLSLCKRYDVNPQKFLEHWHALVLSGRVHADDKVLTAIGIDLSSAELSESELQLLTTANVDPSYLADRKKRAAGAGIVHL